MGEDFNWTGEAHNWKRRVRYRDDKDGEESSTVEDEKENVREVQRMKVVILKNLFFDDSLMCFCLFIGGGEGTCKRLGSCGWEGESRRGNLNVGGRILFGEMKIYGRGVEVDGGNLETLDVKKE